MNSKIILTRLLIREVTWVQANKVLETRGKHSIVLDQKSLSIHRWYTLSFHYALMPGTGVGT